MKKFMQHKVIETETSLGNHSFNVNFKMTTTTRNIMKLYSGQTDSAFLLISFNDNSSLISTYIKYGNTTIIATLPLSRCFGVT